LQFSLGQGSFAAFVKAVPLSIGPMSKGCAPSWNTSSVIAAINTRNYADLQRTNPRVADAILFPRPESAPGNAVIEAMPRAFNVLFLCTGNSARSIMAEAITNRLAQGKFRAYSAGSQPKGALHPKAVDLLRKLNYDVSDFRSKSWEEFSRPDAPRFDFVFTVCDNAAAETCPVWPGQPMTAHWGVPDPAAVTGNEAEIGLAFADAYRMLYNRISTFVSLPIGSLDQLSLKERLHEIGRMKDGGTKPASAA
jgi:protein-tyrosine-phosphatase